MVKKISDAEKIEEIMQNESRFIVSKNVKFYRKKRGMTQAQLASKIGKTVEMVCQIENNVAGTKLATLDAIANVLDIETYMLFLAKDRPSLENISPEILELIFDLEEETPEFISALREFIRQCRKK
ncbi:MAG: helix-turn-helix domain-containing protein [Alphaproteobacteria bacterium]|nr:helix-turn-helix domain-containing protein [Alphaproteobacteria bacterium]